MKITTYNDHRSAPFPEPWSFNSCQVYSVEGADAVIQSADHLRRATGLSMSGCWTYRGWPRRRLHSPRAERMKVKPPSPPSAQSVQTKKKPPVDLAISP